MPPRPVSLVMILAILLALGLQSPSLQVPPFVAEGDTAHLTLRFAQPVQEPVELEVVEFHYFQHPELAPVADTWLHEHQMAHQRDVEAGRAEAYRPTLDDPKVAQILRQTPAKRFAMQRLDDRTFGLDWKATHGRIYFRPVLGSQLLDEVASTRVHCRHADLRAVEPLKKMVRAVRLPLKHGNLSMAASVLQRVRQGMEQGHSLFFMLRHHEFDASEVESALARAEREVAAGNAARTVQAVQDLSAALQQAERHFRQAAVDQQEDGLHVRLSDIAGFDYAADPATRVFLRPVDDSDAALQSIIHGGPGHGGPAAGMDHSQHMKALAPDLDQLLQGARELEREEGAFLAGSLNVDQPQLLIVIYGSDAAFYWTERLTP